MKNNLQFIILRFIYEVFRIIINFTKKIYFRKIRYHYAASIPKNAPIIVVSNHPNTLMDALVVASALPFQLFFLANSSLFNGSFANWFFTTFYCIPIQRKIDTNKREVNNMESFRKCIDHFVRGGNLFIAPEGGSIQQRRLQPLKSGTARIAINTILSNPTLPLYILPVGLNYETPNRFRKNLLMNVGEPILVNNYLEDAEKDFNNAYICLTEEMEASMQKLIIITESNRKDLWLHTWEKLAFNQALINAKNWFPNTKKWSQLLLDGKVPTQIISYTKSYQKMLNHLAVSARINALKWYEAVWLVLGIPVFVLGFINNFLPWFTISKLLSKIKPDVCYHSTFKYLAGFIFVPLFYGIQIYLSYQFSDYGFYYALSLIPLGLLAWNYSRVWLKMTDWIRWKILVKKGKADKILKLEKEIFQFLKINLAN